MGRGTKARRHGGTKGKRSPGVVALWVTLALVGYALLVLVIRQNTTAGQASRATHAPLCDLCASVVNDREGFAMAAPRDREGGSPTSYEGVPVAVVEEIARLYDLAMRDVNVLAGRALERLGDDPTNRSATFRLQRAQELQRRLAGLLEQLGRAGDRTLAAGMGLNGGGAIEAALARARAQLAALGLDSRVASRQSPVASLGVGFLGRVDEGAVRKVAEDIAARQTRAAVEDMQAGARRHAENAILVFQSLSSDLVASFIAPPADGVEVSVNRAIARGLIAGDPKVTDRAIRDLFRDPKAPVAESVRRLGNTRIQVGGWTGTVRAYASTVTRTRTREATVAARHERLKASRIELAQIVGAVSENPCTDMLGLIVSITGSAVTVGGVTYPPVESLPGGGPPFHPNCSKGTAPFDAELSSPERRNAGRHAAAKYRTQEGVLRAQLDRGRSRGAA